MAEDISWTKRSVRLPNDLWERVAELRHEERVERFNEALRRVIERGLGPKEGEPDSRRRVTRATLKVLALLIAGGCIVSVRNASTAELLHAQAKALDYVVLADDLYDPQEIAQFICEP